MQFNTKKTTSFLDGIYNFFLGDFPEGLEGYTEKLKFQFVLRLCFFFLIFELSLLPTVYLMSFVAFIALLTVIVLNITIPFIIKKHGSVFIPTAVFLLVVFIYIAHLHIATRRAEGLAIVLWYVVIILSAIFVLNKKWGGVYVVLSLGMIMCLSIIHNQDFFFYEVERFNGADRIKTIPFRLGFPMCLIFLIAKDFVKDREKAIGEAIRYNRAKNDFISSISHELRTPLNAVIALGHNLLDSNPKSNQKEDLQTILFSSNSLLNSINDILDFNSLDSGKIELKKDKFNLSIVLNQIISSFQQQLKPNLYLTLKIDKQIPPLIIGDVNQLIQILNNLTQNAIKFTLRGGITINVSLNHIIEDKVSILFEVIDTGIGIEATKIDAIFKRFTQVEATLSRRFEGLGLGLAIVKKMLIQLNSSIQIKSEFGKGSIFFFNLIFEQQKDTPLIPPTKELCKKDALNGVYVLLVEDNKINQLVAKKLLSKWKAKVDVADNGKIAVEKIKRNDYDMILMDLEMPIMNGLEATQIIKKIEQYKSIPIIAVTASTNADIISKIQDYQFDGLVQKPFIPKTLYNKMVQHYRINNQPSAIISEVS